MQIFHDKTEITLKNSFEQTAFIDWRTQPRNYKRYPEFFRRYKIDEFDELKFIKNFGKITQTKKYGKEEISLRTNPSAGGLYPCEVYIQIRGVKGFLSGIYHYEPLEDNLVLIHELSNDGLEYYFEKNKQYRFVILISNVYFRSSWKYENRAIRYLLLDTGHQIGSIYSSLKLENIDFKIEFEFDRNLINESFGFEGFEFFQVAILSEFHKEKETKPLRENLVNVSACDYQIRNSFIDNFINHLEHENFSSTIHFDFLEELEKKNLEDSINKRRSIRAFKQEAITKNDFNLITKDIFEYSHSFGIEIYIIVNNIIGLQSGIYKNVTLLEEGNFIEHSKKLAFNQKLGGTSCFTLFFTSKVGSNYIQNYILCGFLAHMLSIRAINLDISSSGIGAYFDDECKKTFKTQNNILYLQAIGK